MQKTGRGRPEPRAAWARVPGEGGSSSPADAGLFVILANRLGSYRGTALAKRSRAVKGQVIIRLQPLRTAMLCCAAFLHGYPKATLFCRERCQRTAYFLRHNLNRQEAVFTAS